MKYFRDKLAPDNSIQDPQGGGCGDSFGVDLGLLWKVPAIRSNIGLAVCNLGPDITHVDAGPERSHAAQGHPRHRLQRLPQRGHGPAAGGGLPGAPLQVGGRRLRLRPGDRPGRVRRRRGVELPALAVRALRLQETPTTATSRTDLRLRRGPAALGRPGDHLRLRLGAPGRGPGPGQPLLRSVTASRKPAAHTPWEGARTLQPQLPSGPPIGGRILDPVAVHRGPPSRRPRWLRRRAPATRRRYGRLPVLERDWTRLGVARDGTDPVAAEQLRQAEVTRALAPGPRPGGRRRTSPARSRQLLRGRGLGPALLAGDPAEGRDGFDRRSTP